MESLKDAGAVADVDHSMSQSGDEEEYSRVSITYSITSIGRESVYGYL